MSDIAPRDDNRVPTLLGVSDADGTSPVTIYASATGHRLLISGVGTTGPTGPTGATGPTGPDAYTPASGALWTNPDPTTLSGAIDRLAVAVAGGVTGPIA